MTSRRRPSEHLPQKHLHPHLKADPPDAPPARPSEQTTRTHLAQGPLNTRCVLLLRSFPWRFSGGLGPASTRRRCWELGRCSGHHTIWSISRRGSRKANRHQTCSGDVGHYRVVGQGLPRRSATAASWALLLRKVTVRLRTIVGDNFRSSLASAPWPDIHDCAAAVRARRRRPPPICHLRASLQVCRGGGCHVDGSRRVVRPASIHRVYHRVYKTGTPDRGEWDEAMATVRNHSRTLDASRGPVLRSALWMPLHIRALSIHVGDEPNSRLWVGESIIEAMACQVLEKEAVRESAGKKPQQS